MSQLEEIKARVEGHTEGPWFAHQDFIDMGVEDATKTITNSPERYAGKFIASVGLDFEVKSANAELIAAAPKLLAALEAVTAVHAPIDAAMYSGRNARIVQVCTGCGQDDGNWQRYPCPTVRAITEALA